MVPSYRSPKGMYAIFLIVNLSCFLTPWVAYFNSRLFGYGY